MLQKVQAGSKRFKEDLGSRRLKKAQEVSRRLRKFKEIIEGSRSFKEGSRIKGSKMYYAQEGSRKFQKVSQNKECICLLPRFS